MAHSVQRRGILSKNSSTKTQNNRDTKGVLRKLRTPGKFLPYEGNLSLLEIDSGSEHFVRRGNNLAIRLKTALSDDHIDHFC